MRGPGGCDCRSLDEVAIVYDSRLGEYVCTNCAVVVEAHALDQGPDWFGAENARCGPPNQDAAFVRTDAGTAPPKKKYLAESDPDKKLRSSLRVVERFAGTLRLEADHNVTYEAKRIFTDYFHARAAVRRPVRQPEIDVLAACSLYFACKSGRIARALGEISGHCQIALPDLSEAFKDFKILLADRAYSASLFQPVSGEDLLIRVLGGLEFEHPQQRMRVEKEARAIFGAVASKHILEGCKPHTVCSAVVLLALQRLAIPANRPALAKACGVSVGTINKNFKELIRLL